MATDDTGPMAPESTGSHESHDPESISQRVETLTQAALGLREELGLAAAIEERTTEAESNIKKTRRWVRLTIIGLILSLGLTLFGGALYVKVNENTQTIKRVQCSLYALVLSGGYHPERHLDDLGSTPAASLTLYNRSFAEIIRESNDLGCTKAPSPTYVTDPSKIPVPELPQP